MPNRNGSADRIGGRIAGDERVPANMRNHSLPARRELAREVAARDASAAKAGRTRVTRAGAAPPSRPDRRCRTEMDLSPPEQRTKLRARNRGRGQPDSSMWSIGRRRPDAAHRSRFAWRVSRSSSSTFDVEPRLHVRDEEPAPPYATSPTTAIPGDADRDVERVRFRATFSIVTDPSSTQPRRCQPVWPKRATPGDSCPGRRSDDADQPAPAHAEGTSRWKKTTPAAAL